MKKILGIDYGEKRVGVAISDTEGNMGFASHIFENDSALFSRVAALVGEEGIATVVVGHSRNYAGRENPIAARAQHFARALETKTGCRLVFMDETLTSAEARRQFEQKEKTRAPLGRAPVDASAAALILQKYIDTHAQVS